MCHRFFITSSVDGHLSCFHGLAVVNRAAVNIGVHVSFGMMVFFRYVPGSGIVLLFFLGATLISSTLNFIFRTYIFLYMISNPVLNFKYKSITKSTYFCGGPLGMHEILPPSIVSRGFSIFLLVFTFSLVIVV